MAEKITPKKYIHKDMTVLDVLFMCRETEEVFRKYDEQAGVCICCDTLFETLETVSAKYGLDLARLLYDLEKIVRNEAGDSEATP